MCYTFPLSTITRCQICLYQAQLSRLVLPLTSLLPSWVVPGQKRPLNSQLQHFSFSTLASGEGELEGSGVEDGTSESEEEEQGEEETSDRGPEEEWRTKVPAGTVRSEEADEGEYCLCQGPYNGLHDPMIECYDCATWFHCRCIGIEVCPPDKDSLGRKLLWFCKRPCLPPSNAQTKRWNTYSLVISDIGDEEQG